MKFELQTLSTEAENAIREMQAQGKLVITKSLPDPPKPEEMSFLEIMEAMRGLISKEEGEARIAQIRYERDHDWE